MILFRHPNYTRNKQFNCVGWEINTQRVIARVALLEPKVSYIEKCIFWLDHEYMNDEWYFGFEESSVAFYFKTYKNALEFKLRWM